MPTIKFHSQDVNLQLPKRRKLKAHIKHIIETEGYQLENLSIIFCNDQFIQYLNKSYLAHDYATDILTFDMSIKQKEIEGELYISLDTVLQNAKELSQLPLSEICRVIFHGVLHLCGYGDSTPKEISQMRIKEEQYLTTYK